ncbi:DUF6950 family protein [Rhodoligotrophos ferricapiens]|uniref:DUF6950 family protein n=1 Tax=Rhodoligotrophos ferricapiens TaxID=3069264 RepID=UPI00315D052B
MRLPDWPERMIEVIRAHERAPFEWGKSDCWCLAMDVVKAITGSDPYAHVRRYQTAAGSRRVMRTEGFASIGDALAAAFVEIPPVMAQRGDLGVVVVEGAEAVCICEGVLWVGKSPTGVVRFPRAHVARAFKV